jgi:NADPH-dependent 2,4-dienoyl-CoA reductase/sulfur reductase-like enzyme
LRVVVVVGSGIAGVSAANEASRAGASVTVIERGQGPIPYVSADDYFSFPGGAGPRTASRLDSSVDLICGEEASSFDAGVRRLNLRDRSLSFDSLVLTTGMAVLDERRYHDMPNMFMLGSDDTMQRLLDATDQAVGVVVVGDDIPSLMAADVVASNGANVTLIDLAPTLPSFLDYPTSLFLETSAKAQGVRIVKGRVDRVVGVGRAEAVLCKGEVFPLDALVVSPRKRPCFPQGGVVTGTAGSILVGAEMRTSAPGVFAAGACAEQAFMSGSVHCDLPTCAAAMGRAAGMNSSGGHRKTLVTRSYSGVLLGTPLSFSGITSVQARALGLDAILLCSLSPSKGDLVPRRTILSLVLERRTQRVLGVQMAGCGALGLAPAFSVAVSARLRLKELASCELPGLAGSSIDIAPLEEAVSAGMESWSVSLE